MTHPIIEKTSAETAARFSILTLVNDDAQYAAMQSSFRDAGFTSADTEFLAVRHAHSAFASLNDLLNEATGDLVILCHQDIRLAHDVRQDLEDRLGELTRQAPDWALAGNAGGERPGRLAVRISDPHGANRRTGDLPARVASLDENFVIARRKAGVRFSRDLDGFHLYGADLCLHAEILGYSSWVIDFHLQHLSPGNKDQTFRQAERHFIRKWNRALRPRWLQTPCTLLRLSGGTSDSLAQRMMTSLVRRVSRRLPSAAGWTPPPHVPPHAPKS
ncbi:MAG: hypothetical protein ACK5JT_11855 [Hyphomicrobiaceae bacterium]